LIHEISQEENLSLLGAACAAYGVCMAKSPIEVSSSHSYTNIKKWKVENKSDCIITITLFRIGRLAKILDSILNHPSKNM